MQVFDILPEQDYRWDKMNHFFLTNCLGNEPKGLSLLEAQVY